jgi:hypothetical protein
VTVNIEIPLPAVVQVRNVVNYKGNRRAVLLIDGEQVLFRGDHVEDEGIEEIAFRHALKRMFIRYLREHEPWFFDGGWSTETDREIDPDQYSTLRLMEEEWPGPLAGED